MVGMRKIEIWRLKPVPRKVAAVGEELFEEYLRKKQELCPKDLGTDWFGRMMAGFFKNDAQGAKSLFYVVDTSNTSRTIYAKYPYTGIPSGGYLGTTTGTDSGAYIGIGTGTTSPTKQDYKLASEIARAAAGATYADGNTSFSVSATFSLSADTEITEVGLYYKEGFSGWIWLLDRTLLSPPVTFPANTPMVVNYVFAI
jgi:hypothetical protein